MPRDRFLDDERDDRPARSSRGLPIALIAVAGAILLVVLAGVAVAVLFVLRGGQPANPVAVEVKQQSAPELGPDQRPKLEPDLGPPPRLAPGPSVVAVEKAGRSVIQLVFGGDEHGAAALLAYKDGGGGHQIDVVDTVNGRARGRVEFDNVSINGVTVSSDGKWLGVVESAPSDGDRILLYDVATGRAAGRFTPYGKHRGPGVHVPNLVWTHFVAPDRLLTITESSGFDVWSVPRFERVAGQPPRGQYTIPRVEANLFTQSPVNFAITRDGKTLVLFNGSGFTFYDTRTGAATGKTEPFMKGGGSAIFFGAAIRADGTRFACYFASYGDKDENAVAVWEVPSGKRISTARPTNRAHASGMAFWGPDHLVYWQGGKGTADIVQLATGEVVGKVQFRESGLVGTVSPTDGLWGITPSSRTSGEKNYPLLVRGAALPAFRPGAKLVIGPKGLIEE